MLYVFGKNFFTERDHIDFEESAKTNTIVWTRKPRVVNFCPYCRAVLYSMFAVGFVFIWRLFPHKPNKAKSLAEYEKSMRKRSQIIRIICGGLNIGLGLENFIAGDWGIAIFQTSLGLVIIFPTPIFKILKPGIRSLLKFIEKYWPRKTKKVRAQKKTRPQKSPSFIKTYLTKNHEKFCPPVAFVDPNDTEIRR